MINAGWVKMMVKPVPHSHATFTKVGQIRPFAFGKRIQISEGVERGRPEA